MSEQTRIALRAARKCIQTDRAALHACHFDPAIGRVDDTGQMALTEYDAVLAQIDAALAAPAKLTDEQIDAIFDAHNEAPTMSYRYWVARAIERALLEGK